MPGLSSINDLLVRDGFVEVAMSKTAATALACSLGTLDTAGWTTLRPQTSIEARANTLSSRYGLGEFPWHTDGAIARNPPRWVFLRSANDSLTDTELLDVLLHDRLASALCATTLRVMDPAGRQRLLRAGLRREGSVRYRWDPRSCEPLKRVGRESVPPLIAAAGPDHRVRWRAGRTLVVDNWRMLHRRPAVVDASRRLERLYSYQVERF